MQIIWKRSTTFSILRSEFRKRPQNSRFVIRN